MKTHRTDAVSLVFGVIFAAGGVWWLLTQLTDLSPSVLGWLAAGGLIVFGLLGLFGALRARPAPAGSPATGSDRLPPAEPAPPVDAATVVAPGEATGPTGEGARPSDGWTTPPGRGPAG